MYIIIKNALTVIYVFVISCFCFICFSGGKITQSSSEGITLIDSTGTRISLCNTTECDDLPAALQLMWKHAQEARNHCLVLERMLSQLPGENFPVIVGRRPNTTLSSNEKENQVPTVTVG